MLTVISFCVRINILINYGIIMVSFPAMYMFFNNPTLCMLYYHPVLTITTVFCSISSLVFSDEITSCNATFQEWQKQTMIKKCIAESSGNEPMSFYNCTVSDYDYNAFGSQIAFITAAALLFTYVSYCILSRKTHDAKPDCDIKNHHIHEEEKRKPEEKIKLPHSDSHDGPPGLIINSYGFTKE